MRWRVVRTLSVDEVMNPNSWQVAEAMPKELAAGNYIVSPVWGLRMSLCTMNKL